MKTWIVALLFACACIVLTSAEAAAQGGIGGRGSHPQSPIGSQVGGRAAAPRSPARPMPGPDGPRRLPRDTFLAPLRARPIVPFWFEWPVADQTFINLNPPEASTLPPPLRPASTPEPSSIQPALTLTERPLARTAQTGSLRLEVAPRFGQLYVDGFYAGQSEDIVNSPTGLSLPAGWHRLEYRASGYETAAANVTIVAEKVSTVRITARPLPR